MVLWSMTGGVCSLSTRNCLVSEVYMTSFFAKHAAIKQLVAKLQDTCYDGVFTNAPIHLIIMNDNGRNIEENCIPDQESGSYASLGLA